MVGTDGGALKALRAGVPPHIVLGDMDSLPADRREQLAGAQWVAAPDQEASDLEKAVHHCVDLGATEIRMAAAGGGRIDHLLAAYSVMVGMAGRVDVRLCEPRAEAMAVAGDAAIYGAAGNTLSLVAMAPVRSVWLDGVRWPLRDEALLPGSRGVSNRMEADIARLRVEGGTLIVCRLWSGRGG